MGLSHSPPLYSDVGFHPPPPLLQELRTSTAIFIDALSGAGMCNCSEGGAWSRGGRK